VKCPICNSNNPHEARFCASCGIPLGPQGELSPRTERRREFAPLNLGGLLEETSAVYRRNFRSFVLIALLPQIPLFVFSLLPELESWVFQVSVFAIFFLLYFLAAAATVRAVALQYTERPIDVADCYGKAWFKVISLVVSNMAFGLALIGAIVTIVGIPLFFYLIVVWYFFIECIMVEKTGPMAALWRSRDLVRGSYWRIIGIAVVYTVIVLALSVISLLITGLFANSSVVLGGCAGVGLSAVAAPITWIGKTLVYFDLRVRKENYTMNRLASEIGV
jgi:hypothetical protein